MGRLMETQVLCILIEWIKHQEAILKPAGLLIYIYTAIYIYLLIHVRTRVPLKLDFLVPQIQFESFYDQPHIFTSLICQLVFNLINLPGFSWLQLNSVIKLLSKNQNHSRICCTFVSRFIKSCCIPYLRDT